MTTAFPVGLIAMVLSIVPSYASDSCPGCLYGYYPKVREFGSLEVSDVPEFNPPVQALNFTVTPMGECNVTFVLFTNKLKWGYFSALYTMTRAEYDSTIHLYSVEEVPLPYAYQFNEHRFDQTLKTLSFKDATKVVLMAWKERPSWKDRRTGYQLEAVRKNTR
ncbi:hypothetical protein FOZ60_005424 [Perkinsus olseni]|uniref:Uncharacterized protein n=1 Tax=Perkinsus olseni TaxID=32597 RepID=A0A7J6NRY5_PEROL|nr:hypothetical protein FOZ60_005424 [Perkinsus olseni]